MYDSLLLPTDGSDASRAAVDHGLALAASVGATVRVLSVAPSGPHGAMKRDQMRADPQAEAESAIEAVESVATGYDVVVESVVESGLPQEVIVAEAERSGVDAIVMGTAGRSGIDHVLLGSVTEEVLRSAPVPVIVVGPEQVVE